MGSPTLILPLVHTEYVCKQNIPNVNIASGKKFLCENLCVPLCLNEQIYEKKSSKKMSEICLYANMIQ